MVHRKLAGDGLAKGAQKGITKVARLSAATHSSPDGPHLCSAFCHRGLASLYSRVIPNALAGYRFCEMERRLFKCCLFSSKVFVPDRAIDFCRHDGQIPESPLKRFRIVGEPRLHPFF